MARIDTLANFLTDVATAIKDKKGDTTPILASNFDTEIANLPSGGGIPVFCGGDIVKGLAGTTITITNTTLTNPTAANNYYNVESYKLTPDLVLVYAFVRGGTTYEVSSNLTVIAETDWAIHTTDNLLQKLIVAKADLSSTEDYIITQPTSGRMQCGYCKFYNAGEPEIVVNEVGGMNDKEITTSSPDSNLYMYVGSAIYSNGTTTGAGVLQETYTGDVTYIDHSDRLFFCWTNRKTDLTFTLKVNTPCYQFLGLKIPYKE